MKKITLFVSILILAATSALSQSLIAHPWQGKFVAYLGDSITDPRNKASENKYWSYLKEWLGITPYVYAVSGRQWTDVLPQAEKLRKEHADNFDAIMIFMGTNDYNNAVPIGEWFVETMENVDYGHRYSKREELRKRRVPSMDPSTFKGRMNIALDSLKRSFPDKQIVLLTPIHRAGFYHSDTNWQVPEDYANRCGEYLDAYVKAVKEAGEVWGIPVIDLNSLSGLYPLHDTHAKYFNNAETDRLHPNDSGHERIAATLYYQLLNLPCTFTKP